MTSTLIILLCVLALSGCQHLGPSKASKPNVLLILLDDAGFNDTGIFNTNDLPTPTLNRLAQQGLRFSRHYADSTCAPSRAALLTGLYATRVGFQPNGRGISPDVATIPRVLKKNGYRTHHIGKWHIGHSVEAALPSSVGFDTWFAFWNQWLLRGTQREGHVVYDDPTYLNPWLESDSDRGKQYQGHLTEILTERAKTIISETENQPWFINLWYYGPHTPVEPLPAFADQFPNTPKGRYYALMSQLDTNISELVDELQRTAQLDNTVIIVLSDNGGTNRSFDNNFPFSGNKSTYGEGGLRTPLFFSWPEKLKSKIIDSPVSIMDIFPTILSMLHITTEQNLDGVDLMPLAAGAQLAPRLLYWERTLPGSSTTYTVLRRDWESRLTTPPQNAKECIDTRCSRHEFQQAYDRWHIDVHQVTWDQGIDADSGDILLTGNDFLRSPGFGEFTFGIKIRGLSSITRKLTIASQKDFWSVVFDPDSNTIELNIGNEKVTGTINPQQCNSILWTGSFLHRLNHWQTSTEKTEIKLFSDGVKVSEKRFDFLIDAPGSLHYPIIISQGPALGNNHSVESTNPLILSSRAGDDPYFLPQAIHAKNCGQNSWPK